MWRKGTPNVEKVHRIHSGLGHLSSAPDRNRRLIDLCGLSWPIGGLRRPRDSRSALERHSDPFKSLRAADKAS